MAQIQLKPEVLEQKAKEIEKFKGNHEDLIKKLTALITGLNDQWKGEAQQEFVDSYKDLEKSFLKLSNVLKGYKDLLTTYAKDMRKTEEDTKNKAKKLPSDAK